MAGAPPEQKMEDRAMDFGIQLATSAHHWKVVKRAEEMGFTHAWFYDTQLLNADVFVAMAAAAMQTSRIKLCTGVLIPSNRIAPVAASALASLNALAPGRIVFGMSHRLHRAAHDGAAGDHLGAARGIYPRRARPFSRRDGRMVRGRRQHKIRFLNPELGLINLDDPIPIHISAFGPQRTRARGEARHRLDGRRRCPRRRRRRSVR